MTGSRTADVRLLLDTHILIWWIAEEAALARVHAQAITEALSSGERLAVSAITFWEIAKLVESGKLRLLRSIDQMFDELDNHPQLAVLPLSSRVSLESTRLGPRFHRDPADQIIVATARVYGLRLVTADTRIQQSGTVSVVV
jgi:PIN domain nuclease of toxin-antitoxin system